MPGIKTNGIGFIIDNAGVPDNNGFIHRSINALIYLKKGGELDQRGWAESTVLQVG